MHEIKLDGYRLQIRVENGHARLLTRSGLDWTAKFPEVAAAARPLPDCIIDGEVVALDTQRVPSFCRSSGRVVGARHGGTDVLCL